MVSSCKEIVCTILAMPSTIRNFDAGWMWYYINPEDQSQLLDMSVAAARLALKQVTFIDRLLTFVEERRVLTRWGYDDTDEVRERWISRYDTNVTTGDPEHRAAFVQKLDHYLEETSLIWTMAEEMQVLRK